MPLPKLSVGESIKTPKYFAECVQRTGYVNINFVIFVGKTK